MTLDEFFAGFAEARPLFDRLQQALAGIGPAGLRVSKSQIAFRRRSAFAWAWVPARYLRRPCAPLVLSIALQRRDGSTRWKQVVEPAPGRYMHHLELYVVDDIDDQARAWLQEAWQGAA